MWNWTWVGYSVSLLSPYEFPYFNTTTNVKQKLFRHYNIKLNVSRELQIIFVAWCYMVEKKWKVCKTDLLYTVYSNSMLQTFHIFFSKFSTSSFSHQLDTAQEISMSYQVSLTKVMTLKCLKNWLYYLFGKKNWYSNCFVSLKALYKVSSSAIEFHIWHHKRNSFMDELSVQNISKCFYSYTLSNMCLKLPHNASWVVGYFWCSDSFLSWSHAAYGLKYFMTFTEI